jgi:hypothetical protein
LIGVGLSSLEPAHEDARQLELFSAGDADTSEIDERRVEVDVATDEIRRRFGDRAISVGDRHHGTGHDDGRARSKPVDAKR